MADIEDTVWHRELEEALIEGCDFGALRNICKGRKVPDKFRSQIWKICLNVAGKGDSLDSFDGIFDMTEQDTLRTDSKDFIDKFNNSEEEKLSLVSDLESVITFYCKSRDLTYTSGNGWLDILGAFIALNLERSDLYNCFYAVMSKYIPRDCKKDSKAFSLFRLLLLYHDPELCNFLDTKRVTPDCYARLWLGSLFTNSCTLSVVQAMWDIYVQQGDPFLVFFLSLVILINAREHILALTEEGKQAIITNISSFPCQLEADDVEDFCTLAQYYASKTPQSFRREYQSIFGLSIANIRNDEAASLSQALCLPVSMSELLQTNQQSGEGVRFFVVDCRPAEQYNSGHLPIAFHLDANLLLEQPTEFSQAVKALFAAQQQAIKAQSLAGGEHLCFMGSGREEEDQYVHMVVAHFLQRKSQYVSMAAKGFSSLHQLLSDDLNSGLTGHDNKRCIVCTPEAAQKEVEITEDLTNHNERGASFMNKLTSTFKSKSATVKEKMIDFIKNEQPPIDRHVSSHDTGKPYRGVKPVFTINDDEDDGDEVGSFGSSDDERREIIHIETWLKKSDVKYSYQCQEVNENGYMVPSYLLVTNSHLYILRETSHKPGFALIQGRRPLNTIVKITSKKRHPELITFRYGTLNDDGMKIESLNRFIIPKAGDATKSIKMQIMKVLDALST
uniref:TBC1 domain family member 23 n=1 Tax=Saccoglossus kowalevskii TaxID=10224 RepID=A0ABM0M1G9_SACKO|nr:PREDICTED: TBC1 domain family member 23-like [Saccoglossus kowalevskii]